MADGLQLTQGAILDFYSRDCLEDYRPVLQIIAIQKWSGSVLIAGSTDIDKYLKFLLSDGTHFTAALSKATEIIEMVDDGMLVKNTVVQIARSHKTMAHDKAVFLIMDLIFVCDKDEKLGNPLWIPKKVQVIHENRIEQPSLENRIEHPSLENRIEQPSLENRIEQPCLENRIVQQPTENRIPATTSRPIEPVSVVGDDSEDKGIAACSQKLEVHLDVTRVSKSVIVYDLETGGLRRGSDDILQVGAVRLDIETGTEADVFNAYITPTGPISAGASNINNLYITDDGLCKKSPYGHLIPLETAPYEDVLRRFVEWALQSEDDDPSQVLLVGYNNFHFDDDFIVRKFIKYLSSDLMILVRKKFFSSDVIKLLPKREKLVELYRACGGASVKPVQFHDAVADCRALCHIIKSKKIDFGQLSGQSQSFDSVICAQGNPLLKSGLITKPVADKIPVMRTAKFLELTDEEVKELFRECGVKTQSMNAALRKREHHRQCAAYRSKRIRMA